MQIETIFPIIDRSLTAVKYEDYEEDEFSRLMDLWTDVEYLHDFFSEHIKDLQSGFYGEITISEAIEKTIEDAENLEQELLALAKKGKTDEFENLQRKFRQLDNNDAGLGELQKSKAKGEKWKSWIRIYAIRIGKNHYVISGGAIKLTLRMEEREHTNHERFKLSQTKNYLQEMGIFDSDDFETLELS